MAVQLILKNSSIEDKRPTAAQLANGELSINYNEAGPFIACKDTAGNIQSLGGVKFADDAPGDPPAGAWWYNTAATALFVFDGTTWQSVGGGGGGGGISAIIGGEGIDATYSGSTVTLDIDLAGGNDGLEFNSGQIKATTASKSAFGSVSVGDNVDVSAAGQISIALATESVLGVVKAGAGIDVAIDGTISVDIPQTLTYRGSCILADSPTGQLDPSTPVKGDAYVNSANTIAIEAGWTGLSGSSSAGDLVVWDGSEWELIGTGGTSDIYLRTDASAGAQVVESTDPTTFVSDINVSAINFPASGASNTIKGDGIYVSAEGSLGFLSLTADKNIGLNATNTDGFIRFTGDFGSGSYRFQRTKSTDEGLLSFESLTADRTFTYPDANGTLALTSDISGKYLSLAANAGAQFVKSTGSTDFKGGVDISGGDNNVTNGISWRNDTSRLNIKHNSEDRIAIRPANTAIIMSDGGSANLVANTILNNGSFTDVNSVESKITINDSAVVTGEVSGFTSTITLNVDTPLFSHYTTVNGGLGSFAEKIIGFKAEFGGVKPSGDASDPNIGYGFYANIASQTGIGQEAYQFFALGTAPSFLKGSTYIGGTTALSTVELWKSTLTEEQLEELTAGTLVAPANVSTPGDGSFARQWYYNQQDAETQAELTAGTLEYPTHLAAATFVDNFALGDNTKINLLSNGTGQFKIMEADKIAVAQPADFWNLPSSYIGFESSNKQLGSITTGGGYATTLYSNGYRDNTNSWKSLDVNGIKGGSQLNILPDGRLSFSGSADTSLYASGQNPGKTRLTITPSASDDTCTFNLNGSTLIKADAYTATSELRALRILASDDLTTTPTDFIGVEVVVGEALEDTTNIVGIKITYTDTFTPTGVSDIKGITIANLSDKGDDVYGIYSNVLVGTKNNYNFYAPGTAPNYFKGNIDCDGSINGAFSLRMQADDPAAFTTTLTTDEEGNDVSDSVYNGTTEDLLSIIKDLRARVTTLEAAAGPAPSTPVTY